MTPVVQSSWNFCSSSTHALYMRSSQRLRTVSGSDQKPNARSSTPITRLIELGITSSGSRAM